MGVLSILQENAQNLVLTPRTVRRSDGCNVGYVTDFDPAAEVLIRTEGSLGRLTLNRPKAINALNITMIRQMTAALEAWRHDSDIDIVLIDGAGERGLCAGGDVRALYDEIVAGHPERTLDFFRAEYTLNAMIAEYPKPVVAFADGVTMGGGIGLAGHAAIRVVTERSKLAMPETRIGFTPDVGGTYLLGRAPGRIGEYLGVTGTTMSGSDAIYAGFADYYVPSAHLDELREALAKRADPTSPSELVLLFDETPEPSPLVAERAWIDEVFSADTIGEVAQRLSERQEGAAPATAALLTELAPTGLAVTLEAVREAREGDLRAALEGEYRRVLWFGAHHPDLVEGIRAQLVDKDRSPKWKPATIAELAPDATAAARAYVPEVALFD
ncbi:MAG TPA: 3-hydroxyisobutyryl-CoA hydrolase [Microbacterium sp.]|nr:3-hydroxyisobutyryl-CoA hydrolase [Microbacterium sp.]